MLTIPADKTYELDAIHSTLRAAPYRALRAVRCQFVDDRLVLTGSLPSFYLKQLAQTHISSIHPTMRLDNRIEVSPVVDDFED